MNVGKVSVCCLRVARIFPLILHRNRHLNLAAARGTIAPNGMSGGMDNDYLQHAQIIQGVLIFLSACTAVLGYVVQSRLAAKAAARELEHARIERHKDAQLKELRLLLSDRIGPIHGLLQTGQNTLGSFAASALNKSMMEYWMTDLFDGLESMMKTMHGKCADTLFMATPFTSKTLMAKMKADPDGEIARNFRSTMRVTLEDYFEPAAELLRRHMNELNFPTREDFVKKFPVMEGDPQLRKKFFIQHMSWSSAMKQVVKQWDRGDFTNFFPPHQKYPFLVVNYLSYMLDEVKDEIKAMTAGHIRFNNVAAEVESQEVRASLSKLASKINENKSDGTESEPNHGSSASKSGGGGDSRKKTKKYAVISAVGSATAAAVAGVASQGT